MGKLSAGAVATKGKLTGKIENIHDHRAGDAFLPIRFDSIHSAKGGTQATNLVLRLLQNSIARSRGTSPHPDG
ncbi:MAG TPA: hypothetical protein VGN61_09255 [Verrucomicrobiae bacterium]|jgi:hypothetical protein